jgi:DNA-binding NarL/FixJ family response regulator
MERIGLSDARGELTRREIEVLHWVAAGKSNKDIARAIDVTSATVKKHLEHIYQKLRVRNRTAAGTWYVQRSA